MIFHSFVIINPLSEIRWSISLKTIYAENILDFSELTLLVWYEKDDYIASPTQLFKHPYPSYLAELHLEDIRCEAKPALSSVLSLPTLSCHLLRRHNWNKKSVVLELAAEETTQ